MERVVVVGSGLFGVTAALELRRRGWGVTLLEAGRVPDPRAASTDLSKACRMEYGSDGDAMARVERAREGWLRWNERWEREGRDALYHECGVLMLSRSPLAPGGFEHESLRRLEERGHRPERIAGGELVRRFPAWSNGAYVDGFFHRKGGYAESGRVVGRLAEEARRAGVDVREGWEALERVRTGGRTTGVRTADGSVLAADAVVVCAGSWTAEIVPELGEALRPTGHAVFHLAPRDPALFEAPRFPVFTADIARTGFYGFPLHPRAGVVKIALHDRGVALGPDAAREVSPAHVGRLRAFLPETFPALADAPLVSTRLCPYSDTADGDFWIARHPEDEGLTVAAGGSGHAFKFAPLLGEWIADAATGRANPDLVRYAWRGPGGTGVEQARCRDPEPT